MPPTSQSSATPGRRGRPALRVFTLAEACEVLAELREMSPAAVLAAVSRAPLSFFSHARQNGDGSWRVPERDVRDLLGVPGRAVKASTFAMWCDLPKRRVLDAMRAWELRSVVLLGQRRIPVSEFTRLMQEGSATAPRRRFSFSRQGAKREVEP